jgi:hypothetical protein
MQRIFIGSALVILCAAVAAAQNPPGTVLSPPGTSGPGVIAPGAVQKNPTGTIAPDFKPLTTPRTVNPSITPQTVSPSIKKGVAPTAPAGIAPATLPTPSLQTQSLSLSNGTAFNTTFDRNTSSFKTPLADGTYKLNNGGAIRVRGGAIVWDAFGVIDRLNVQKSKGQKVAEAPIGIG